MRAALSTLTAEEKPHPLAMMRMSSPVMAASALIGVFVSERDALPSLLDIFGAEQAGLLATYFVVNILLVFSLVLAEYRLVLLTSSLTVSVLGVCKELATVLLAIAAGESFSTVNAAGLALCLAGNVVYFLQRSREKPES